MSGDSPHRVGLRRSTRRAVLVGAVVLVVVLLYFDRSGPAESRSPGWEWDGTK